MTTFKPPRKMKAMNKIKYAILALAAIVLGSCTR